ncbi:hypothetical protein G6F63_014224 [Rhizopus arrhizus]|nr:hypothetical protein G6F63_014224 [Rhizopus arrhizus]
MYWFCCATSPPAMPQVMALIANARILKRETAAEATVQQQRRHRMQRQPHQHHHDHPLAAVQRGAVEGQAGDAVEAFLALEHDGPFAHDLFDQQAEGDGDHGQAGPFDLQRRDGDRHAEDGGHARRAQQRQPRIDLVVHRQQRHGVGAHAEQAGTPMLNRISR